MLDQVGLTWIVLAGAGGGVAAGAVEQGFFGGGDVGGGSFPGLECRGLQGSAEGEA
jgi:hypothetical protein